MAAPSWSISTAGGIAISQADADTFFEYSSSQGGEIRGSVPVGLFQGYIVMFGPIPGMNCDYLGLFQGYIVPIPGINYAI